MPDHKVAKGLEVGLLCFKKGLVDFGRYGNAVTVRASPETFMERVEIDLTAEMSSVELGVGPNGSGIHQGTS